MLVIFDWDGTLCDSTDKIVYCMQRAAEAEGLESLSSDAIKNIIGLGLPEALRELYPSINSELVDRMRHSYAHYYLEADQTPSLFFPGVEDVLETLLSRGDHLAVATGKSRAGLNRVMLSMGAETWFHGSRCSDETASKPHPKMLHELLIEFRYTAGDAVMVGDTEFDMEMAMRADMPRIAVDYGAHHVSRLEPYQPLACLSSFSELTDVLPR